MDAEKARQLLEQRRTDLEVVSRAATEQGSLDDSQSESTGETSMTDQHHADMASDTLEREVDFSVREGAEARLRDIDRALRRLANGSYGVCKECGRPISDERLEARPEAEYCVEHEPRNAGG